jgi:phospholipase C
MPAKKSVKKAKSVKKSKSPKKAVAPSKKLKKPVGAAAQLGFAAKKKAVSFVALADDPTLANLDKIEHIVVLMLENRSFDHILGYLTLENGRTDVDGLTADMHNDFNSVSFHPKQRTNTAFGDKQDPCHGSACVTEQLQNSNGGFVSNYAHVYPNDPEVDLPMNYYNGAALKVFKQLVSDSCICDRWFCSVDGATWPFRPGPIRMRYRISSSITLRSSKQSCSSFAGGQTGVSRIWGRASQLHSTSVPC